MRIIDRCRRLRLPDEPLSEGLIARQSGRQNLQSIKLILELAGRIDARAAGGGLAAGGGAPPGAAHLVPLGRGSTSRCRWCTARWPCRSLPTSAAASRGKASKSSWKLIRRQPFDLGQPPLLRLDWVRTGEAAGLLAWTYHHILLDAWSASAALGGGGGHLRGHGAGRRAGPAAGAPLRRLHRLAAAPRPGRRRGPSGAPGSPGSPPRRRSASTSTAITAMAFSAAPATAPAPRAARIAAAMPSRPPSARCRTGPQTAPGTAPTVSARSSSTARSPPSCAPSAAATA